MPNIHLPKACLDYSWKKPDFFGLQLEKTGFFFRLLEKNYFCNTDSKYAKFFVNKLAFCQLSILWQK
jgi:hypothetical protein